MKRTSPTTPPTIQELITSRIKQHNLSRSEFIQAVGYKRNISKGLRRLDSFLHTLEYPNDDFLRSILRVLEIDGLSFYHSFMVSKNIMARKADDFAKHSFNPHVEVLVNDTPSPWFAAQFFYFQRRVIVPVVVQSLPIIEELDAVISIYKEHVETITAENLSRIKMILGFKYHRRHNYYFEFDTDFILKKVHSITAYNQEPKKELGNQVFEMMIDHWGARR